MADKATETEVKETLSRDEVQAMINGAFKDGQKRTEKLLKDTLAQFAEGLPKPADPVEPSTDAEPKAKGAAATWKDSAEYKAQQKQIADMAKRMEDSERRAKVEAEGRRSEAARGELRRHLVGANVREEMIDVVLDSFEKRGVLRFDDEGKPLLAVKRARLKDGPEEEQTFEDFKQGVADWTKTAVAAACMKAPLSTTKNTGTRTPGGLVPTYAKEAVSDEEAVARVQELMTAGTTG